jgi:CBS domain-containing protein
VHDVVEFLRALEPFMELDESALAELAGRTEVEFFGAGEIIFRQGEPGLRHVRVIRRGGVELVDGGRVLDLLGEGEWFGHPAMLSGLPTSAAARAAEDTVCYRLAAEDVLPLLARPTGLRFLARSLMSRPRPGVAAEASATTVRPDLPAHALIHEQLVLCASDVSIRDAARRMADARASCALVALPSTGLGILTDHDLRVRVVADGVPTDAPISEAMSAPAVTVGRDELGSELMLTMIDRGVRHLPVISDRGEPIGVVTDVDLLAAEARTPLIVRRAIEEARDLGEVREAAQRIPRSVMALHEADVGARQIGAIMAATVDAVVRRTIELRRADGPPHTFTWMSLGSYGRREPALSSDLDSALAWEGESADRPLALARAVIDDLSRAGLTADSHGANAANPLFAREAGEWRSSIARWLGDPGGENVLMAVSLLADGRVVAARGPARGVLDMLGEARHHPSLLRLMRRLALAHRPPTGFLRDIVVEHGGAHRGHFDIKHGGLLPIVGIGRYAGLAAGTASTSTRERLRAASAAGILREGEASSLEEALDLFSELRLEHQVQQLEAAQPPDDFVDPRTLNALTRRYVRDAFRVVTAFQRALSSELVYG